MGYFDKLHRLGFTVVCHANRLGTTTMTALRDPDYDIEDGCLYNEQSDMECPELESLLACLPEWRRVDFVGDDAAKGAKMLYEKLTLQGDYAKWDERLGGYRKDSDDNEILIGFEHRPESERFLPVDDAPAPPPELVENLNLQGP